MSTGKLRPFQPGVSGNPKGRPKGIVDKRMAVRRLIGHKLLRIVETTIEKALEGDIHAIQLILERAVPRLKSEHPSFRVELHGDTFTDKGLHVLKQVAAGELPADVAAQIMSSLFSMAKMNESTVLEERLARMEKLLERQKET